MSIIHLSALALQSTKVDDTFWTFILHHRVFDLGVLTALGGVVVANMGIWKMMDAVENRNDETTVEPQMFSVVEEMAPKSGKQRQSEAIDAYREMEPDGPYLQMLTRGQLLVVFGFVTMLIGIFI